MNGNNAGAPSWLKWVGVVAVLGFMVAYRFAMGERPPASPPPRPAAPTPPPGSTPVPDTKELVKTDLKVGTGKEAKTGDAVTVNYRGTLTNGTVFDESYKRGQPFDFTLGSGVIEGWSQGVAGMKEGGKRKLIIPPSLGYGAQGAGNDIPPNATLIFEIELLKVNSSAAPGKAPGAAPGKPGNAKPAGAKTVVPDVKELVKTDLKVGSGKAAKAGDAVSVNYRGTLTDGTVFDESYKRGQPFDFTLGSGVIEGWSQGVAGMKEGGKRKLVIPPSLGYGAEGAGGVIPPNATLIFEIELLKVQ